MKPYNLAKTALPNNQSQSLGQANQLTHPVSRQTRSLHITMSNVKITRRDIGVGLLVSYTMGLTFNPKNVLASEPQVQSIDAPAVRIRPELRPDQRQYDASDPELREAGRMIQQALNAPSVEEEESLWTEVIARFSPVVAPWRDDVVGRAYGNRGNARSRQGKFEQAIQDLNTAIDTCPWTVDPILNRGVVLEAMGRFEEAKRDYLAILEADPEDPAIWNNLGNASMGIGDFDDAVKYYDQACNLSPQFAFAAANKAIALFASGRNDREAIREMKALVRRHPFGFSDVYAALAAALWSMGDEAGAEQAWTRVDDVRYKSLQFLRENRRWPSRLIAGMSDFLKIQ